MINEKKQFEFITCLECGKDNLKQINYWHLKYCPGSCNNSKEYLLKHPGASLLSDQYHNRRSKISKNMDLNCNPKRKKERLARSRKGARGRHIKFKREHPKEYRQQIENFIRAGIPYRGRKHKRKLKNGNEKNHKTE